VRGAQAARTPFICKQNRWHRPWNLGLGMPTRCK
jgi:hypothetical protein